MLLNLIYRSVL